MTVSPQFRRATGLCRWCKAPKNDRRSVAEFCSKPCRDEFHNNAKKEGASIVHVAKRWRRYKRKGDFALMSKMIDDLIRADKELGRDFYPDPPTSAYAKVVAHNIAGRRKAA